MKCFYHPDRDAVNTCSKCGLAICSECNYVTGTHPICRNCWDKHVAARKVGVSSKLEKSLNTKKWDEMTTREVRTVADLQRQNMEIVATASQARIGVMATQNTSGQGKTAIIPYEVKGWNWGAFLLNWIWGIGNRVWIALIVFIPIPFLALIMTFVLGAKGNEWAWRSKRWDSVEHFRKTQRTWRNWGIGVLVMSLLLYAILFIVGLFSGGGALYPQNYTY